MANAIGLPAGFVLDEPEQEVTGLPPGFVLDAPVPLPEEPITGAEEGAVGEAEALAKGLGRGFANVVSGVLQTGADILGSALPDSEKVEEFRGLLAEAQQRGQQQFEAQTAGTIGGPVGEFVGEAAPYLAAIPAGAVTMVGRIGIGAAGGALAGATAPTEEQLTPEEALAQRGEQAAIGGAIGAVAPVAFAGARAGVGGLKRLATGLDADKLLANRITAGEARKALGELKEEGISVLADVAGDEIQGLTRAIGRAPGGARNIVTQALEERSEEAIGRVTKALSKGVSNVDAYFANIDDMAKARAAASRPVYTRAFKETPTIKTKKLDSILADNRIQGALKRGRRTFGISDELADNSIEVLDATKKSLDDTIGKAIRAGEKQRAKAFVELKIKLIDEIDQANPTYKEARKIFSDFASMENAQKLGLDFTKQTPEQLKLVMKTMDNTQKEAFRIGVRENLQRTVSKTADQADPAKRIFGNDFKRDQLKAIFGGEEHYNKFSKAMRDEIRAAKTKFKVLGGSRTDINIADDGQFINAASDMARRGVTATILEKTIESITSTAKRKWIGLSGKNAKQLAKILTDKDAGINALEDLINKTSNKTQKALLRDASRDVGVILGVAAATGSR